MKKTQICIALALALATPALGIEPEDPIKEENMQDVKLHTANGAWDGAGFEDPIVYETNWHLTSTSFNPYVGPSRKQYKTSGGKTISITDNNTIGAANSVSYVDQYSYEKIEGWKKDADVVFNIYDFKSSNTSRTFAVTPTAALGNVAIMQASEISMQIKQYDADGKQFEDNAPICRMYNGDCYVYGIAKYSSSQMFLQAGDRGTLSVNNLYIDRDATVNLTGNLNAKNIVLAGMLSNREDDDNEEDNASHDQPASPPQQYTITAEKIIMLGGLRDAKKPINVATLSGVPFAKSMPQDWSLSSGNSTPLIGKNIAANVLDLAYTQVDAPIKFVGGIDMLGELKINYADVYKKMMEGMHSKHVGALQAHQDVTVIRSKSSTFTDKIMGPTLMNDGNILKPSEALLRRSYGKPAKVEQHTEPTEQDGPINNDEGYIYYLAGAFNPIDPDEDAQPNTLDVSNIKTLRAGTYKIAKILYAYSPDDKELGEEENQDDRFELQLGPCPKNATCTLKAVPHQDDLHVQKLKNGNYTKMLYFNLPNTADFADNVLPSLAQTSNVDDAVKYWWAEYLLTLNWDIEPGGLDKGNEGYGVTEANKDELADLVQIVEESAEEESAPVKPVEPATTPAEPAAPAEPAKQPGIPASKLEPATVRAVLGDFASYEAAAELGSLADFTASFSERINAARHLNGVWARGQLRAVGHDASAYLAQAGADKQTELDNALLLGGFYAQARGADSGEFRLRALGGGLYASLVAERGWLDVQASASRAWVRGGGGFGEQFARAEAGLGYALGSWRIEPSAGLAWLHQGRWSYENMHFRARNSLRAEPALAVAYEPAEGLALRAGVRAHLELAKPQRVGVLAPYTVDGEALNEANTTRAADGTLRLADGSVLTDANGAALRDFAALIERPLRREHSMDAELGFSLQRGNVVFGASAGRKFFAHTPESFLTLSIQKLF